MKKVFEIYGSDSDELESIRLLLEATLGVTFSAHESSTSGLYYLWGPMYGESLVLERNHDDEDGEPADPRFPDAQLLLYVNLPSDPQRIRDALASIADRVRFLLSDEQ